MVHGLAVVAVLQLFGGSAVEAACPIDIAQRVKPEMDAALSCALDQARRLEPSGESAEVIGQSAVEACARTLTALDIKMQDQFCRYAEERQLLEAARQKLARTGAMVVVQMRAQRKGQ